MRILFLTDLHAVHTFLPALLEREAGAELCLLGGDFSNFQGPRAARAMIEPLRRAFPRVRAVAGNTDRPAVIDWLQRQELSLHGRGEGVSGLWLSGASGSNHTPLHGPIEYSEPELATLLAAGRPPAEHADRPWILVTHVPPRDTVCDRLFVGKHVGSSALRRFLQEPPGASARPTPTLHLCGHIHEGVGVDRLGTTVVCNPGALTAARYAVIHREGDALRPELCQLSLPRSLRMRATVRMIASKVTGYARHRLGR